MLIDRRTLFAEAWTLAHRLRAAHGSIRAAFGAALRKVWELVKAMAAAEACRPTRPVQRLLPRWEDGNGYRAAAVVARRARLGTLCGHAW